MPAAAALGSEPDAATPVTSRSRTSDAGPRGWRGAPTPTPSTGPPETATLEQSVRFAKQEAIRLAEAELPAPVAALDVLRWASRRRTTIEAARDRLQADEALDADTKAAATAILDRVLAVGLLY